MQTILITGGAGFVGSNLAILLKQKYPRYSIICLDNLKRRGSELNLNRLKLNGIEFVHGDIRNKHDFDQVLVPVHCVIEAAAEPSVLAGLNGQTDYLIDTNLNGTINALNFALKHKASFIFLSTSRVYPIRTIEEIEVVEMDTRFELAPAQKIAGVSRHGISEKFPLEGSRSLYGATKLASELMVEEYHEMFGLKTVINRCGVLTGPHQMGKVDQGVVVLWMARHFWKGNLSYVGYGGLGKQVRDMLHINDLFDIIDRQLQKIETFDGQTFNIGGGRDISASLLELTHYCQEISGNKISIEPVAETRKADIRLYISDCTRIHDLANWTPKIKVPQILEEIFQWIRNNEHQLKPILT
jgi:CDP-paratose 2-epimerase